MIFFVAIIDFNVCLQIHIILYKGSRQGVNELWLQGGV